MKDKDGASGGDIVGLLTEENGSKGVTQVKKRGKREMKRRIKKTAKQERCAYIKSRKVLLTVFF